MNAPASPPERFKLHWHVLSTHFPLSLFSVALLFQVLHLFVYQECFELASTVLLVLGAVSLVPTAWTGYATWKGQYRAAQVPVFRTKVAIALALLALGVPMSLWRVVYVGTSAEAAAPHVHWPYFLGTALMCAGSILEGYYGGRLTHRPRIRFQKKPDSR